MWATSHSLAGKDSFEWQKEQWIETRRIGNSPF